MSTTNTTNGAEAILEILELHGTEFIFCSQIAVWAPLWEALAMRHEAGVDIPRYINCAVTSCWPWGWRRDSTRPRAAGR